MSEPTCETCRFFSRGHGWCRRYPPVGVQHAHTRLIDWCGEHKPITPEVTVNDTP